MLESILRTKEHNVATALESLKKFGDPLQNADLAEIAMDELLESLHNRGDHNHFMLDMVRMMMLTRDLFLAMAYEDKEVATDEKTLITD